MGLKDMVGEFEGTLILFAGWWCGCAGIVPGSASGTQSAASVHSTWNKCSSVAKSGAPAHEVSRGNAESIQGTPQRHHANEHESVHGRDKRCEPTLVARHKFVSAWVLFGRSLLDAALAAKSCGPRGRPQRCSCSCVRPSEQARE